MASERYTVAVARNLQQTLHPSAGGFRCRCGACRHHIVATARRTGIPVRRLLAALPPERPIEEKSRRRRQRPPLQEQVAHGMVVSRGRRRMTGTGAVVSLLSS